MLADWIYAIAFFVTAAATVTSALMVVLHRNPVINALYLVLCFFGVAVMYVLLESHLLAALQVLLYAGAVLVLFLMIIMLIRLDQEQLMTMKPKPGKAFAVAAVLGVILVLVGVAHSLSNPSTQRGRFLLQREQRGRIADFLIDLGDRQVDLNVVPSKEPLSETDKVQLARQALTDLGRPETLAKAQWPGPFRSMGSDKIQAPIAIAEISPEREIIKTAYQFHHGNIPETFTEIINGFPMDRISGTAATSSTPSIITMMWRGVRNWPLMPAVVSLLSRCS